MSALDWLGAGLLLLGSLCLLTGAVGMLRLPGFFMRTHAASVTDSAGAGLILLGLLCYCEDWSVALRLLLILLFALFASPTATHALAQAAIQDGLKPVLHTGTKAKR